MNFFLQNKPVIVPAKDGKLIEEHFGKLARNRSIACIVHPKERTPCRRLFVSEPLANASVL